MGETMYDRLKDHHTNPQSSPAPEQTEQTTEQQTTVPKESPVAEQQTEQTTQTEEQKPQATEQQPSSQESTPFDVGLINERFGSSFKDENEIKSLFEKQPLLTEYETKLAEREKAIQEKDSKYQSLLDSVQPDKLIPDKEMFTVGQLKDKYPGVDPALLSKIRTTDLATLDKLEALVILDKLSVTSNVSDKVRREEILKGMGVEDAEELTENDRYKIEREYAKQSNVLNEIKEFQPDYSSIPIYAESKEHHEKRAQQLADLKTRNETAIAKILSNFNETKSPKDETFKYVVSQEWKDANLPQFVDALTNGFYDVGKNVEEVRKQIESEFRLQNFEDIMQDVRKQALTEAKQAAHNEIHSNTQQNTTEAPTTQAAPPKTLRDAIKEGGFRKVNRNY